MLELETQLQKERERLGELRKKHYELAGVAEGWGEEQEGKASRNSQHLSNKGKKVVGLTSDETFS